MSQSEKLIFKLKKPVVIRNADGAEVERIEKLELRELFGKDVQRITATTPMALLVQMVGASSDLPPSTIDRIPLAELIAAGGAAAAAGFFADIPQIHETSKLTSH